MSKTDDPIPLRSQERDDQLEKIRTKIIDAIRFSEKYWMTYKEHTFGLATIIDLIYKKSYIEVLFFPKIDTKKHGVPPLKIYSPLFTDINFDQVLQEPEYDEDGLISPTKIIKKINNLLDKELQSHIALLDEQIEILDKNFENYPIDDNIYYRKLRIYLDNFIIKCKINFADYPKLPAIEFSSSLNRVIENEDFYRYEILKHWNEQTPPTLSRVLETLMYAISQRLGIEYLKENSQHFVFKGVSITDILTNVSFRIRMGQSIGIYYELEDPKQAIDKSSIMNMFRAMMGTQSLQAGEISILGDTVQFTPSQPNEGVSIVTATIQPQIEKLTISNALTHGIRITTPGKSKKKLSEKVLETTGLINKKSEKVANLNSIERVRLNIARALLQSPNILIILAPHGRIERLDLEQFNVYMEKIRRVFHLIMVVHGPSEIVSSCTKVLTITKTAVVVGEVEDILEKIPQSGEIITVELNSPPQNVISSLFQLPGAKIIEERKGEKYKIFSREDPDHTIIQIMNLVGPFLYNFKRFKTTLNEYFEFMKST